MIAYWPTARYVVTWMTRVSRGGMMIEKYRQAIATLETAVQMMNLTIIELHVAGFNVMINHKPLHRGCNTIAGRLIDTATDLEFEIDVAAE